MNQFQELYRADILRYGKDAGSFTKRFHRYLRKAQCCRNPVLNCYYRFLFDRIKRKRGIEMSFRTKIGKGFYLGHPFNITVNKGAEIGENCNLHKGVTIGQENRGKRKGAPKIGNCVWVGVNATVVGNVTIGDDVLIAPNSYVNCDVPSHSVVFGNPCIIKPRENATEDYLNRKA